MGTTSAASSPDVTVTSVTYGSGNLDLTDAAIATDSGFTIVVAAALYNAVRMGEPLTYAAGTGTAPTAFAAGIVYAYKHTTANTLSIFSTATAAVAPASDAAAIAAGLDVTTGSAGTDHTFTFYMFVPQTFTVKFLTLIGDLPLFTADVTSLTLTGQSAGRVEIEEKLKGTYEDDVCSGLGICDRTAGTCKCLPGYTTSDYAEGFGDHGDCGFRLIYPDDFNPN
jgi:hypothetical protein